MAVAQDSTASGSGSSTTSITYAHNVIDNTNGFMSIFALTFGSLDDLVTSITYNSVGATRINSANNSGGGSTAQRIYGYGLIANASGNNNVVITTSASTTILGVSIAFTGANQSSQPDNQTTNVGLSVANLSYSLTPSADNTWIISACRANTGTPSAGTDTGEVIAHGDVGMGAYDSDFNPISPASSTTLQVLVGLTNDMLASIISIAPVSSGVAAHPPRIIFY